MKRAILLSILILLILSGCAKKQDARQACCSQCRDAVNKMFEEQPQIAMPPDSVDCTYFKDGKHQLTKECTEYFDENQIAISEC
ncbi:hypothetical protein HYS31_07235 [Candidatus Woesearchaeota archaeon]|nr:hypothetical protein [Candidatus Woesearchaeota archaeon]